MIPFNTAFTSYRREASGSNRQFSSTATITGGKCFLQPLDGDLKNILGIDMGADAFVLTTDETNIQKSDKIVISSVNYYVKEIRSQSSFNALKVTRLVIYKAD